MEIIIWKTNFHHWSVHFKKKAPISWGIYWNILSLDFYTSNSRDYQL